MSLPADTGCGHVGPPLVSAKVKVVDVPDMNYYASNGEGEICFKGPSCTSGYFKEEEKTKALIDEDGWVHSGDIGKWLPNGTLKITDRLKHIFKLSQVREVESLQIIIIICIQRDYILLQRKLKMSAVNLHSLLKCFCMVTV